jgi:uncharacterized protein DUF3575
MKKSLFILLLCFQFAQGQDSIPESKLAGRNNEVRIDLLSLIASSKLNLTYERFLGRKFSVGVTGNFTNGSKLDKEFDEGNRDNNPQYEIIPFVRYKLSQGMKSFYFTEVFVAANAGDFRETVRKTDGFINDYYVIEKSTYSDVALGAGLGYKFYIKDRLGIELLVGFGWNLLEREKSPDVLSRVGLSVGYRF